MNYENNVFVADVAGARNIKSKVASLSFKSGSKKVDVNNTQSPIVIKLQNKVETYKKVNISLPMPGLLKFHTVKLDSIDCQLLLNIDSPEILLDDNDTKGEENESPLFLQQQRQQNITSKFPLLHVYVQYGKPPSRDDHDFRFALYRGKPINVIRNETRVAHVEMVDNRTLFMWSFDEFEYGRSGNLSTRRNNRTLLYIAFHYDGLMPDLQRFDNPYTFDILEKKGNFNFTLISFCAKCSYWNEKDEKWKSDGCEVRVSFKRVLTNTLKSFLLAERIKQGLYIYLLKYTLCKHYL